MLVRLRGSWHLRVVPPVMPAVLQVVWASGMVQRVRRHARLALYPRHTHVALFRHLNGGAIEVTPSALATLGVAVLAVTSVALITLGVTALGATTRMRGC